MKRNIRIEEARQFAKKMLSGKYDDITKEDYQLLLISKFILLKERIIKTDETHTAYFDAQKNSSYLPIIKYISGVLLRTNKVNGVDLNKVNISPPTYATDELKKYIWVFNKLRDCLGHGKYEIDSDKNRIIIKNPPYMNNLAVPIEILEMFNFLVEERESSISPKKFHEYNQKVKRRVHIDGANHLDERYLEEYRKFNAKSTIMKYPTKYYNLGDIDNIIMEYQTNYAYNNYKSKVDVQGIKHEIDYYVMFVKNSTTFSKQQKEEYLSYINDVLSELSKYQNGNYNSEEYRKKVSKAMKQLAKVIGIKSPSVDFAALCATYNYGIQVLTEKVEAIKDNKVSSTSLGHLKMRKLTFSYAERDQNGRLVPATNSRLTPRNHNIIKLIKEYASYAARDIATYNETKNPHQKRIIIERYKKFCDDIYKLLGDRNKEIISSLRNALEHGNILDIGGQINLYDQNDHTDNRTINFVCGCRINDFYELLEDVDLGRDNSRPMDDEFMQELKAIIPSDMTNLYNELENAINGVKIICQDNLLSVLRQASKK